MSVPNYKVCDILLFFRLAFFGERMHANRAVFFRSLESLRHVSEADYEELARVAEVFRYTRKAHLWKEGDLGEYVYFLRSGVLKLTRELDENRTLNLGFFAKGDVVGEGAVLGGHERHTNAVVYQDVEVYRIAAADLARIMEGSAEVSRWLAAKSHERRRDLERRVGVLLFKTAHARIASLLLDLAKTFGVRDSRGTIVNLKLTHRELAAMIGATRETVSFAIVDLRKKGLVETEGKRVILLDEPKLRDLMAA